MSATNGWDDELNTRREIPYLQVTIYYFVYYISTMALYSQEAPTSLMNENKWIDNSQITIMECVGANYNSLDGKMRWITISKTTMFAIYKVSFIDFVLINRKSLSGKRPNSASSKSSSCRFSFSAARNANTKAVTFGFSFCIFVFSPSRKVWI